MCKTIVYSKPNCGGCNLVKAYLTENNVEFEVRDITEGYLEEFQEYNYQSLPLTVKCDKVVVGYNPPALAELIQCCSK